MAMSSQCYLEMKDESGKTSSSPAFSYLREYPAWSTRSLRVSSHFPFTPASVESSTDPAGLDAKAMAVPDPSSSADPSQPSPLQSAPSASNAQPPAASQSPLSLEDSRIPAPTAAYAVPLSLVSTILVAASGLAIHQRRKLRAERLREQEALKARSSSGRSTLDPVGLGLGFHVSAHTPAARSVAGSLRDRLGHGRAPASIALSTSASMSRMRAWRRDVSRHEPGSHPHGPALPDDEETYVARSDDGHDTIISAASSKAYLLKTGEPPRRPTKAPFYASTGASRGQPRHTTVPASMFRESPIGLPYHRDGDGGADQLHYHASRENKYATYGRRRYIEEEEKEHGRLKRRGSLGRVHRALGHTSEDYCQDATTKADGVMPRDVDLFQIPLSPAQPHREAVLISRPERLRNGPAFNFDKVPRLRGMDGDPYDVVARKVSRGDLV